MDNFFSDTGIDSIHIVIGREQVESKDINSILISLSLLSKNKDTILRFRQAVILSIDGYDNDPRELFEIEEVRNYVKELDLRFPFWFYFLSLHTPALKMIALCQCRHEYIGKTVKNINNDDYKKFLESHFKALNSIFVKYGIDENLNAEMSSEILKYMGL
jgi:hypothetical protein